MLQRACSQRYETAGVQLRYLPRYSPDLNPIEMLFSKFKVHPRKADARMAWALRRRIGSFVPRLAQKSAQIISLATDMLQRERNLL